VEVDLPLRGPQVYRKLVRVPESPGRHMGGVKSWLLWWKRLFEPSVIRELSRKRKSLAEDGGRGSVNNPKVHPTTGNLGPHLLHLAQQGPAISASKSKSTTNTNTRPLSWTFVLDLMLREANAIRPAACPEISTVYPLCKLPAVAPESSSKLSREEKFIQDQSWNATSRLFN
jgi:hypothetical protein